MYQKFKDEIIYVETFGIYSKNHYVYIGKKPVNSEDSNSYLVKAKGGRVFFKIAEHEAIIKTADGKYYHLCENDKPLREGMPIGHTGYLVKNKKVLNQKYNSGIEGVYTIESYRPYKELTRQQFADAINSGLILVEHNKPIP